MRAAAQTQRPLIVFDQFEEILTLFEDDDAVDLARRARGDDRRACCATHCRVKLLFAFREDYLGRVKQLLDARARSSSTRRCASARRRPARSPTIIRGPFERFPGRLRARARAGARASACEAALDERFGSGDVSLSEVQTVCLRLWRATGPRRRCSPRRASRGCSKTSLARRSTASRPTCARPRSRCSSQMITSAGTRNVISAEDLRLRVREEDGDIAPALLDDALGSPRARLQARAPRAPARPLPLRDHERVPRAVDQPPARRAARARSSAGATGAGCGSSGRSRRPACSSPRSWRCSRSGRCGQRSDAQRREADATSLGLAASSAEPAAKPARRHAPGARARGATGPARARGARRGHARAAGRPQAGSARHPARPHASRSQHRLSASDGTLARDRQAARASCASGMPAATGSPARQSIDTHDFVGVLAYSPDVARCATAGDDRPSTSGHEDARASCGSFVHLGQGLRLNGLAFSPDAKTLAVAERVLDMGLWDVRLA